MSAQPHIPVTRLEELSREAVIAADEDVRHLRECEECQTLLRILANQRRMNDSVNEDCIAPSVI